MLSTDRKLKDLDLELILECYLLRCERTTYNDKLDCEILMLVKECIVYKHMLNTELDRCLNGKFSRKYRIAEEELIDKCNIFSKLRA